MGQFVFDDIYIYLCLTFTTASPFHIHQIYHHYILMKTETNTEFIGYTALQTNYTIYLYISPITCVSRNVHTFNIVYFIETCPGHWLFAGAGSKSDTQFCCSSGSGKISMPTCTDCGRRQMNLQPNSDSNLPLSAFCTELCKSKWCNWKCEMIQQNDHPPHRF